MWSLLFGKKKEVQQAPEKQFFKRTLTLKQETRSIDLGVTTVELTTVDNTIFLTKVYGSFDQDVRQGRDGLVGNNIRYGEDFQEPEVQEWRTNSVESARAFMYGISEHQSMTYVDDPKNIQGVISARFKSARIVKTEPYSVPQDYFTVVPLLESKNG